MTKESASPSRIQISLPFKPPPYRRGSGPPLAPIGILPEHDSDAFIFDKRVVYDKTSKGELKMQVYYDIGWPDLPAARASVVATKIHEYVSPRALEDFEYKASLERDEEAEREEARKKRKLEIAAEKRRLKYRAATNATNMRNTTNAVNSSYTPTVSSKKRRGRPSKAELQARQLTQQAKFDKSQNIEAILPPASTSGLSLSTPQKKPTREIPTDMEEDVEEADECMPPDDVPETITSGSKVRSYARTLWLNKDSTLFRRTNGKLALKSSTSYVPIPNVLQSNKQLSSPPIELSLSKKPPPPLSKQIDAQHPLKTPVPVPTPLRPIKDTRPKASDVPSETPVPVPERPHQTSKIVEPPPLLTSPSELPKGASPQHDFTPTGQGSNKRRSEIFSSIRDMPAKSPLDVQGQHSVREGSCKLKKRKAQKLEPDPELKERKPKRRVIDEIISDATIRRGGRNIRYFWVRWTDDWPGYPYKWMREDKMPPDSVQIYLSTKTDEPKVDKPKPDKLIEASKHQPPPNKVIRKGLSAMDKERPGSIEAPGAGTAGPEERRQQTKSLPTKSNKHAYTPLEDGSDSKDILAIASEEGTNLASKRAASKAKPAPKPKAKREPGLPS
ncbi:uncharacterized protein GGS25DRAFT_472857 [Hypoxylon fragiforme]|uniref:uncharacterized protein n=1 Tax=Hypoxylon fragiforme TaxID=63214 RepID=UPI0020C6F316|nr:uncharacterized protein GGS25DRAFT_472857 [Hypoxylon fragiforme]KAI2614719.1 hypothetical protein GGS25DRAFT_472857 [Hypoxylon fragiforme]